ncbi:MAG: 50S ribosomal protein L22 [Clostridiaceae bacterium]|jgi:large subunit ribosomal protein L22|nr:50S ribosomal protein L22 [Clostridiaceae bacterium]
MNERLRKQKTYTGADLVEYRDEIIAEHTRKTTKSNRPRTLTKKERNMLGIGKDEGRARVSHVRISPLKARVVAKLVRGKSVTEAKAILTYTNKAAAPILIKLINSAVANAVNNNNLDEGSLYIHQLLVDEGITAKRWRPRARGSAGRIFKRSSHITVVVKEQPEA